VVADIGFIYRAPPVNPNPEPAAKSTAIVAFAELFQELAAALESSIPSPKVIGNDTLAAVPRANKSLTRVF